MSAVLEDAFLCILKNVGARERRRRRQLQDASVWFCSDSREWPFAFLPLCDMLGLDAAAVRQRVRLLLARDADATAPAAPAHVAPPMERFIGRPNGRPAIVYNAHRPPSAHKSGTAGKPESAVGNS